MLIPSRLKKLATIAASEESRYAMNGVCLERLSSTKCRARVTDGSRLVDVKWEDTEEHKDGEPRPFSVIVPSHLWKTALTSKEEFVALKEQWVHSAPKLLVFNRGDCEVSGEPQEGAFPNTDACIPVYQKTDGVLIGMSPELFGGLTAVCDATDPSNVGGTRFHFAEAEKPILIRQITDSLDVTAVLMPTKIAAA